MARGLRPHGILPQLSELIIARTRAHRRMKIDAVDAKQAGIDFSIRAQASTRTRGTEGGCH